MNEPDGSGSLQRKCDQDTTENDCGAATPNTSGASSICDLNSDKLSSLMPTGDVPPEFYLKMISVMQNMSDKLLKQPCEKIKITDIFLPAYDPDGSVGVREWCDHITTAKNNYSLSDYDLRMKVTSLLKGRAKIWADNWLVTTSTWDELRQNIITTFEPESRYSRDVLRFREHTYDSSKDIAEFLSQSWILWRRLTKDKLDNCDAVEAVIGTINDERLRIELMNARAISVPELISVASSIRVKRPNQHVSNPPPSKRSKYSLDYRNGPYCNICRKSGHTSNNCRVKTMPGSNPQIIDKNLTESSKPNHNSNKICSFCSKTGHTIDVCYRRLKEVSSNINSISKNKSVLNTMRIRVGSIKIDTVFDSGAECSVMCESIANKLPGRRQQKVTYLRGIGPLLNPGSADATNNDSVAQVYIDDVISKCRDFSSGLANLERILMALRSSGFSVNIEKCIFFKKSIEYLGNVVENGQVRPSPKKIEALLKAPVPTTVKQIRQFNGLAGYFRRFIPDFARTMVPLYNLTKQNVKWLWTHVHEEARQKIIHHLTSTPVLTIFQEGEPIELFTDASSLGFGGILIQIINGRQHVVAYFSMRTTETESRYHSYELETLAVVRAIKHFRHFLYGRKFTVITDCNAIKASKHKKDLLPRIHRWWAYLQNFDFDIQYRKGERMQHADFLSRNPDPLTVNVMSNNLDWINIEQRRDCQLRTIINSLHNGDVVPGYLLEDSVLKYERQDPVLGVQKLIVVPKAFQWSLISSFHSALKHPGWEKTLQKIKQTYYFDKMSTIIRDFTDNCIVCRTSKQTSGATQVQLHPIPKPTVPFEVIHMDITGKLGTGEEQKYVVVTIDAFTKYVLLRYTNDKSQHSALAALKQVVHLFGAPKEIIVDGGREFLGGYKDYCVRFGITIHSIAPGASRANGQVERVMATLKNGLTMIKNYETPDWHTALESLQLALNCTIHRTTGTAPLTLLTRRRNCVPAELLNLVNLDNESVDIVALERHVHKRVTELSAKDKLRFDKGRAKIHKFQRGDFVLVKNNPRNQTSLDLKFSVPYEVHRVLENDRYLVKKVVGHHGRARKVAHDQLRRAPQPGGTTQMAVSPPDETAGPSGITVATSRTPGAAQVATPEQSSD
ncbi:unnamed protein product [Leptosia nina]|uniref:RNA-directed DNA polymerase n=1 Tax=Leptosia nina TaxID=320188 RepID=A0AAV1JW74_9NEOP